VAEVTELCGMRIMAVDGERFRQARALVQLRQGGGVVHAVLGHFPVGGPLPASDGEQSGPGHLNVVLARQGSSARLLRVLDQWPDPCKYTEDVGACRTPGKVARSGVQNEVDLLFQSDRFQTDVLDRRIGRPDQRMPM